MPLGSIDAGDERLDHVAIAVDDLDRASAPYMLLGFDVEADEVLEQQGVRVRMLTAGSDRLELLEPLNEESTVARFLARRGQGLHHFALRVDSVEAEVSRLRDEGAVFTTDAPRSGHGGTRVIFVHPSWTDGVLVELIERPSEAGR